MATTRTPKDSPKRVRMAPKVSHVSSSGTHIRTPPKRKRREENTTTTPPPLEEVMREVELFNARVLQGKERLKCNRERVVTLGAKPAPHIKTPLKILQGMRKKQKKRQESKEEELRCAGMASKRKKTSRSSSTTRDRGLRLEARGTSYRGGVLRIHELDPTKRIHTNDTRTQRGARGVRGARGARRARGPRRR